MDDGLRLKLFKEGREEMIIATITNSGMNRLPGKLPPETDTL